MNLTTDVGRGRTEEFLRFVKNDDIDDIDWNFMMDGMGGIGDPTTSNFYEIHCTYDVWDLEYLIGGG